MARGSTGCLLVSQDAGSVASSHRTLLPLPTLRGLYEWTLPAGAGSINTSEIPFVLISPEASTETRWLQPAPFTPGTFPPGFDWMMPLFSLCP